MFNGLGLTGTFTQKCVKVCSPFIELNLYCRSIIFVEIVLIYE